MRQFKGQSERTLARQARAWMEEEVVPTIYRKPGSW